MKFILSFMIFITTASFIFAQSDWQIVQSPQEPLIYSRDRLFFLDQNVGWLIGTLSSISMILHTNDGGSTWTVQYNDSTDFTMYDIYFIDNQTGWLCGQGGTIWKTVDGGNTWLDKTPGLTAASLLAIMALDANNVFIVGDDGSFMKSTDGGETWTYQQIDSVSGSNLGDLYAFDADRIFAISKSNDGKIVYTDDDGATWTQKFLIFPPGSASNRSYACDGKADGTAFIVSYHGIIFKSTDFGENWNQVFNAFGPRYKQLLAVNLFGDNIFAGGSDGRLYSSSNNGTSWDTLTFPSANSIHYIQVFNSSDIYIFSEYGQFFKSNSNGQTWTPVLTWPNGYFTALAAPNTDRIVAGTKQGGELTVSDDHGSSWSYPIAPVSNPYGGINDIQFLDNNTGFYCGNAGQIGKTTDGGNTWTLKPNSQSYFGNTKSYNFIYFRDATNVIAGGSSGIIQISSDGGETWTEYSVGTSATLYDCIFLDANTGLIAASSGRIYKTSDGGLNWSEIVDLGSMHLKCIDFRDQQNGFIGAASGYIFKTTDAGNSWTELTQLDNLNNPGDHPDIQRLQFVNATTGYLCGYNGSLFITTDGGDSWQQQPVPGEVKTLRLLGMAWPSETTGFIGTENGFIIATGLTSETPQPEPLISGYILDQNFPNPFNPKTNIRFQIPKAGKIELVVYNTLGQIVRRVYSGRLSAGEHTLIWNGQNDLGLPSRSGIYFYKLEADDFTATNKMILLR